MNKKKSKTEEPKSRVPRKYKYEFSRMLIDHMAQGLSFSSFSAIADVNRDTLYEWLKKYPEFKEARDIGYSKGLLFWEKAGIELVMGMKGSARVWEINMYNRFKEEWKAVVKEQVS